MAKIFREDTPRPLVTKRRIIFGVALLGLVIVAIFVAPTIYRQIEQQSKAAFMIDGKWYSKDEINALIEFPVARGGDKDAMAKQAFEYLKRQAAAKKTGIDIAESDITASLDAIFPSHKQTIDKDTLSWMDLVSFNDALDKILIDRTMTDASGYVYMFPFDRYLSSSPENVNPAENGDEAKIADDRSYAKSRAEYYHDALTKNTMTPDAALTEMQTDNRLGQDGLPNANMSARFVGFVKGDVSRPERYVRDDAVDEVMNLSGKKGIGQIKVGSSPKTEAEAKTDADYQETYYYFIVIDSPETTKNKKIAFDEALKVLPTSYKGIK